MKRNLLFITICLIICLIYPTYANRLSATLCNAYLDSKQNDLSRKVLRFHVLANSNTSVDQDIKLMVRDVVGAYLSPMLEEAHSLSESKDIIAEHLFDIEALANSTLSRNHFKYHATAYLGYADFPEKEYNHYTFPKGDYETLTISLGKGKGNNWWCVLYPAMCFQGSVYELPSQNSEEALRKVLTAEEFEAVKKSGNYKIRFKLLEYLK